MVQLNNTFKQLSVRDESTRTKANAGANNRSTKQSSTSLTSSPTPPTLLPSTSRLLSLISTLTSSTRRSQQFTPTLQHVKSLLYNKEYLTAFGSSGEQGEEFRKVYFARWTPARAVLYERAFQECKLGQLLGWQDDLDEKEDERVRNERRFRNKIEDTSDDSIGNDDDEKEEKQFRVIMIGSGAGAELLALGSILGESSNTTTSSRPRITIQAIDQGNWGELVDKMNSGMKSQWSTSLNSSNFNLQFLQTDLLSSCSNSNKESESLDLNSPDLKLVTILFTITELLLQSRSSTLRFLSNLTNSAPKGLNLLIIESASLALIPIGTNGRTYPLGQLLDHALGGGGKWEILKSEEAKWFRMPLGAEDVYNNDDNDDNNGGSSSKGIRVKLENSRVVLRLYRKL